MTPDEGTERKTTREQTSGLFEKVSRSPLRFCHEPAEQNSAPSFPELERMERERRGRSPQLELARYVL
jgi:hypothetical protein